jgi:pimeloyl-ACP methyl ester carboxylesterase
MSTWQSNFIETNGLRLHYTRTGGNKPPVVLAHGFSDDGLCWTPLAQALSADYDLIMVDARGHGRSDGPEEGYSSLDHAGDLAGVISELGLRRPAVLGHSMGAATTLALAGTHPELPGANLLEDPPASWASDPPADTPTLRERRARMDSRLIALKRKTHDELIAGQRAEAPLWSEAEFGPWADAKLRFSFYLLNRRPAPMIEWSAILPHISCPTLLITADPDRGGLVTAENAAALGRIVRQTRVAHIPAAGHNIRREQFARYLEVVRAFLAEQSA